MPKKIAPLSISVSESKNTCKVFVEIAVAIQIVCGLLVAVFNILFIYYGMSSGWYYFKDSLGTELKVISIGEGIIAGFVYTVFGSMFLYTLHWSGTQSGNNLIIYSVMNILTSLTLVLANTCQLGLISWYVPSSLNPGAYPDIERSFTEKVEKQQVEKKILKMITNCFFFFFRLWLSLYNWSHISRSSLQPLGLS